MIPVLLLSLLFLIIYLGNIVFGFCFLEDGSVYQGLKHKSCWPIKVTGVVLYDTFLHATKVVMEGEQQQNFLSVFNSTMKTRQQSREGEIKGLRSELNPAAAFTP